MPLERAKPPPDLQASALDHMAAGSRLLSRILGRRRRDPQHSVSVAVGLSAVSGTLIALDYTPDKGPLDRNAEEHAALFEALSAARQLLAAEAEELVLAFDDIGGDAAAVGGPEATVVQPGPLRRALERVDWILWTVTLLIAVVAFTLTIYVGKDFGGFADYAAAFVAGFTGAAVANVGLVPLVRALGASAV